MTDTTRARIVVGIDGSPDSKKALAWAIDHARRIRAQVEAVTAWEVPLSIVLVPTATEQDYAEHASQVLERAVEEVAGTIRDVTVTPCVEQGRPARVLTHLAEGADLLVVGSHGRGELPGMHLGSVASYCAHHAPCPVVVLRGAAP
jgi:nucleotide-binding universal stress UspA family protein